MTDEHDYEVPDEVIVRATVANARADGCTCQPAPIIVLTERVVLGEVPGLGRVTGMTPLVYHDEWCPILIRLVAPTN